MHNMHSISHCITCHFIVSNLMHETMCHLALTSESSLVLQSHFSLSLPAAMSPAVSVADPQSRAPLVLTQEVGSCQNSTHSAHIFLTESHNRASANRTALHTHHTVRQCTQHTHYNIIFKTMVSGKMPYAKLMADL